VALALGMCACGSSSDVRDDVAVDAIADAVAEATGKADSLTKMDEGYIQGFMRIDVSECDGFAVFINAYGANIDEFGIFKAGDGQVKDIEAAVKSYLQLRQDTWMDEYMPEEKPKLTSAEVRTLGNYVIYCILSEDDAAAAFDAFESGLKK